MGINQNEITMQLEAPVAFREHTNKFVQLYDLVDVNLGLDSNASTLIKRKNRKCRFCGKSHPDVSFRKDAHLISHLAGNRLLFSDFECDSCNSSFGQLYENDLSNFLGISRSLIGSKGKAGIPTFKCADNILVVRSAIIQNIEVAVVSRVDSARGFFKSEPEIGKTTFTYRKHSYKPYRVYKSILKWALSILPEHEMPNYQKAIDLLQGRLIAKTGCLMSGYLLPFNINFPPHYYLFRKKDSLSKIHTHVVAFYFQNYILSFPIVLHKEDLTLIDSSTEIVLYPPLFTQFTNFTNLVLKPFYSDFNSQDKVSDDKEEVVVMLKPDDLKKSAVYDGNKDQIYQRPYNPADIKSFVLLRGGETDIVNPKEFLEEVKKYFA